MLTASPSHSPNLQSTISSNNGSILSTQSPKPSSRFSASALHSAATSYPTKGATPPLRSSYKNSATQYSPMTVAKSPRMRMPTRIEDILAPATTSGLENEGPSASVQTIDPAPFSGPRTPAPRPATPSQPQLQSPGTKRRLAREPAVLIQSSIATQSTPPKRPKSTKEAKILPARYEFCNVEDLVILIADMISELIETNDNLPLRDVVLTRFHSRTPPGISVLDYLHRLAKHAALTPPLLLSMVYYIDRLCSLYPAFTITTLTVHRFLITAATVAAKGLSDSFWNNSTYARVGGIKLAELGLLELEFLYRVDWRIVPKPETLVEYYQGLVGRTDDYVLESEGTSKTETPDSKERLLPRGDPAERGNVTDNDWNKWMADNATAAKKGLNKKECSFDDKT
ncbi:MAG: hypothetical protein M1818_004013 [Claussenomyces sp. TS43310]|nr:MAG: hypothetical protein M1818_004013 [Claussenomyces sp. TS43310]